MSRVSINGDGHQIEVQHDGTDLVYVIEKAQKLWAETLHQSGKRPSRPVGFTVEPEDGEARS